MLEMHSKRPRFQNFSRNLHLRASKSCLCCEFFPSLSTPKLLPPTENLIEKPCATAYIFVCRRTQNFTTIDQEKHLEPYDNQINQTKFVFGAEFQTLSPHDSFLAMKSKERSICLCSQPLTSGFFY